MQVRLSKPQTNELILKLEGRKYGRGLTSMELAEKAGVSLDYVNRVERQLPFEDQHALERIANALGITPTLLRQLAGFVEMPAEQLDRLEECLAGPGGGREPSPECEEAGLRRVY